MFIVVQIICQAKVLKPQNCCSFAESAALCDLNQCYLMDSSDTGDKLYMNSVVKC